MSAPVSRYRMLVQVRTDLTDEEIAKYEASQSVWPMRDTGEIIHARRSQTAVKFYRALRQIKPLLKIRAVKITEPRDARRSDDIAFRAWRGFVCLSGTVSFGGIDIGDEVKHFAVPLNGRAGDGLSACGLLFTNHWNLNGKPECDKCLAVAVEQHPEMKQYL